MEQLIGNHIARLENADRRVINDGIAVLVEKIGDNFIVYYIDDYIKNADELKYVKSDNYARAYFRLSDGELLRPDMIDYKSLLPEIISYVKTNQLGFDGGNCIIENLSNANSLGERFEYVGFDKEGMVLHLSYMYDCMSNAERNGITIELPYSQILSRLNEETKGFIPIDMNDK